MNICYYLYAFALSSFLFVATVGWVKNPPAVLLNDINDDEMEEGYQGWDGSTSTEEVVRRMQVVCSQLSHIMS